MKTANPPAPPAHAAVYDFFDSYDLPTAQWYWKSIVLAATHTRPWHKEAPINLLHYLQKLQQLLQAVLAKENNHQFKKYKIILQQIQEYALSTLPIDEVLPAYQLLTVRHRVLQLLKASHQLLTSALITT